MKAQNPRTYVIIGILLFAAGFLFDLFQQTWIGNTLFVIAIIFLIISLFLYQKK